MGGGGGSGATLNESPAANRSTVVENLLPLLIILEVHNLLFNILEVCRSFTFIVAK